MRTPNVITTVSPGASVPTFAEIVPVAPFAGVVIVPTVVDAATAFEYVVFAGVASSTTTLVTRSVPTLVTVISYRRQAPGTAPVVMFAVP
jgi:hypothetical protein